MSPGSDASRPRKPALFADLTELIDAAGGSSGASPAEVAEATAQVVVRAGRTPGDDERFVALADRVGIDTLAALWRDADPVSLPGALWALYLLRQWCRSSGEEVTRLWRSGEALAPADAVVAGVADYADVAAIRDLADSVLAGFYRGDLAVALERAAAFFRVVASGRRALADSTDGHAGGRQSATQIGSTTGEGDATAVQFADRNDRVAEALSAAARRWRVGSL